MTHRSFVRIAALAAIVLSGFLALAPEAKAQIKKPEAAKPAVTAAEGQPTQLGTFGSWNVYASDTANGRVCYALAIPKERLPAALKRDPGYFFVSTRPKENVRDELSIMLGFPAKEGADAQLVIGKSTFVTTPKVQNGAFVAWLKNPQDNGPVIDQMKKNPLLSLKVTSKRGNALTETYALAGFGQAIEQVSKACP